ncbi:hypothetical protein DICVIV_03659 [Dictyocaulus viviparus]|uniref:Rapamycin-insensitive companion of mTOR N-terminal domain-containing protein n=1 Tax=Dictyocaulus viviparus TaxID=29172 RepID=A0A0D8Y0L4_DICVI|nr:hypothetical protein DICVIV_03659 [Dictyocaulus viviparus]
MLNPDDSQRHRAANDSYMDSHYRKDKSDCSNFISEHAAKALNEGYEVRRLFLNQLHSIVCETTADSLSDPTFFEQLCSLVLELLRDDHPAIRTMCFRLLRLSLFTEKNLVFLLTSHVDIYAVRALDLQVDNEMEREEALQLIVAMMSVYQHSHLKRLIEFSASQQEGKKYAFPKSVMQPVIALALRVICSPNAKESSNVCKKKDGNGIHTDWLSLTCLEVFLEFCVLEPELILNMAGTDWMVRILMGTSVTSRRVASVVAHIFVSWLDEPKLRTKGKLHLVLEQIFAPLVEFGFFQKNLSSTEKGERIVEAAIHNFSQTFLCILRSWPGLFSCAAIGPNSTVIATSPFRLLEYLGLGTVSDSNISRIRDMIVNICCDFMDMPYASLNFDSWPDVLEYCASITVPDIFRSSLKSDFVLAQSEMLVEADKIRHVDLIASFRSVAGFVLINAGLLQSLARLIVSEPDSRSGLKATLFLSDVLRMATSVMPSGWRAAIHSMPTLVQSACETLAQSKAAAAVHGYYDPNNADRFTFFNSEFSFPLFFLSRNAIHPYDSSLQSFIDDTSGGGNGDINWESTALLLARISSDMKEIGKSSVLDAIWSDSSLQSFIDDTSGGGNGDINWESTALLLARISSDMKEIGKSSVLDAIWSTFEKIMVSLSPRDGGHKHCRRQRFPFLVAQNAIVIALHFANEEEKFLHTLVRYAGECCDALRQVEFLYFSHTLEKLCREFF